MKTTVGINASSYCCGLMFTLLSGVAFADLKPISDHELGEVTGQAMLAFDTVSDATGSFTKFTMGLNTEFQTNIDVLEAGNYTATGETLAADLTVNHLSFGSISENANTIQVDGKMYAIGEIVPFIGNDPYFEIAKNSTGELTGFRVGFSEARGVLSGNFESVSGNIGMEVIDHSGTSWDAQLLDASGNADATRAQHIGVDATATGNTGCAVATYCYELSEFKSLNVGTREADGSTSTTQDFFLSFQKDAVTWQTGSGSINAGPGVFLNVPTSIQLNATTIDANGGAYGIDRVRTEYIDRGLGLF